MKVLAISDRVEEAIYSPTIKKRFGDVELVLGCGDLPFYYMEYVVSMLNVPFFYVRGNHDLREEHTSAGGIRTAPGGCVDIDGRIVSFKGVLIGGLEGSMRYSHQPRVQYTEAQMQLKIWRMVPSLWFNRLRWGRFIDVLITHAPPYRIHDSQDMCHTGFKAFRGFMKRYRPRYLIHGHCAPYCYRGRGDTTFYAGTGVLNAFGFRVIEI